MTVNFSSTLMGQPSVGTIPSQVRFQGGATTLSVVDAIKTERYGVRALAKLREYAAGQTGEVPTAETVLELSKAVVDKFLVIPDSPINYPDKAFALIKELATEGMGPLKPDNQALQAATHELMDQLVDKSSIWVQSDDVLACIKEYADGLGAIKPDPARVEKYFKQIFDIQMGAGDRSRFQRNPKMALAVIQDYAKGYKGFQPTDETVASFTNRLVQQLNYWVRNAAATVGPSYERELTPIEVIKAYGDGIGKTRPNETLIALMLKEYIDAAKSDLRFTGELVTAIKTYAAGFDKVRPNGDLVGELILTLLKAPQRGYPRSERLVPLVDEYAQGIGQTQPNSILLRVMRDLLSADTNELKGGL